MVSALGLIVSRMPRYFSLERIAVRWSACRSISRSAFTLLVGAAGITNVIGSDRHANRAIGAQDALELQHTLSRNDDLLIRLRLGGH